MNHKINHNFNGLEMSLYFCANCFKNNLKDKLVEFFCSVNCAHIFCANCVPLKCETCHKDFTKEKIGPELTGNLGQYFMDPSELSEVMDEAVEFQLDRAAKLNEHLAAEVLPRMAFLKKEMESTDAKVKKIRAAIRLEKKKLAEVQAKINEIDQN